ncbi:MAG TPA: hypothetical protein V6C81_10645 [Planktothrix sp.]|jgi:hypothetical protein
MPAEVTANSEAQDQFSALLKNEIAKIKSSARDGWNPEAVANALKHQEAQSKDSSHLPGVSAGEQDTASSQQSQSPESALLDPNRILPLAANILGSEATGSQAMGSGGTGTEISSGAAAGGTDNTGNPANNSQPEKTNTDIEAASHPTDMQQKATSDKQPPTSSSDTSPTSTDTSDSTSATKTDSTSTTTSDSTSPTTSDSTSTSTIPQSPVSGTGSTATEFGTNAQPTVDQSAPGYYVSSSGSADGTGTKEDPFATLQQAQQAMQNSDIKTTYVEGGTYNMSSSLNLTSADSGESFVSVGGPSNPAVLSGGGKLDSLININGANDVSVEGFSMQDTSEGSIYDAQKHGSVDANTGAVYVQDSTGDTIAYNNMNNVNIGVNMQGDSDVRVAQNSITNVQSAIDSGSNSNNVYDSDVTIKGNDIQNVSGWGSKLFDNVGAININGDTNVDIANNVVQDTAGIGIQMNYRTNGSGFTVSNNTLADNNYTATTGKPDTSANPNGDNGSIHIITQPGSTEQLDGTVSDNYVDGSGINRADKGIYLDDGVNDVTVSGNVVDEGGDGYAMQIHGGDNNVVDGNTFLLGSTGGGILYQTDGYQMTGNDIENNDFESTGKNQKAYQFSNTNSSDDPVFSGNEYSPGLNQSPDANGSTSSEAATSTDHSSTDQSPTNESSANDSPTDQNSTEQSSTNENQSPQSGQSLISELMSAIEQFASNDGAMNFDPTGAQGSSSDSSTQGTNNSDSNNPLARLFELIAQEL